MQLDPLNVSFVNNSTASSVNLIARACKSGGVQLACAFEGGMIASDDIVYYAFSYMHGEWGIVQNEMLEIIDTFPIIDTFSLSVSITLRAPDDSVVVNFSISATGNIKWGAFGPTARCYFDFDNATITETTTPSDTEIAGNPTDHLSDTWTRDYLYCGRLYNEDNFNFAAVEGPGGIIVASPIYRVFVPVGAYATVDSYSLNTSYFNMVQDNVTVHTAYRPVAAFAFTTDDLDVLFDGSASSDFDGTVEKWNWAFGDSQTDNDNLLAQILHAYEDEGTYPVSLWVEDNDGGQSDVVTHNVSVVGAGYFGAHIDHTKTLYTAVDGITIYRFPQGATSRETVGTIAGYKFASLWGDRTGAIYCSAKSASTGEYHVFISLDRGTEWTQITTETMWGTNCKKGIDCGVAVGGGAASVALLTVDSNTQKLLFKYAPDGKTWPPDEQAIEITTLTGGNKIKNAQIRQVPGSIELRVFDGATKVWNSFKLGANNSWNLIP